MITVENRGKYTVILYYGIPVLSIDSNDGTVDRIPITYTPGNSPYH